MPIAEDITELIGNTPCVKIKGLNQSGYAQVVAKLEFFNPLSSVKDRIGYAMIQNAEEQGLINDSSVIIEPTSGNTGVALAFVCAAKRYKLILTMPDTMSMERQKLFAALGAQVVLTDGKRGMTGAIEAAEELLHMIDNSYMPQQFKNSANPEIHKKTTAREIWETTEGAVDIIVAGIGTGGTITGVGEALKEQNPKIKMVAVEPAQSPLLSKGEANSHSIEGIGPNFVPDILNRSIIDEVIAVRDEDAQTTARALARQEGIFAGISSGAALYAALQVAKREENQDKLVVVILPDTGERYLSTTLFEHESFVERVSNLKK